MTIPELINYRLSGQRLTSSSFKEPQEIVSWLGAMQSQDFGMAKWAIGLRLPGANEATVEKAFNDGLILRTHILRPTWHFVTPMDIRWMLNLTAPRVHAFCASYYRKNELDAKAFKKCMEILVKNLGGGNHLTRAELQSALKKKKIIADNLRMGFILMYAELEGIICSGPKKGKQFTYSLLEERASPGKKQNREESLAMLTQRYFASRSPATVQDFAWWSGLTIKDSTEGVAMHGKKLIRETIEGKQYILDPSITVELTKPSFLMPDYDEYGISYKDRSAFAKPAFKKINGNQASSFGFGITHAVIIDGLVEGSWQKVTIKKSVEIETSFPKPLNKRKEQAVKASIKRYKEFFGYADSKKKQK
jgi:hypothetical protein